MAQLTPDQQRRAEEIREFQRSVDYVAKLLAELEANRAAKSMVIGNLCGAMARELSQMRQRALSSSVGSIADVAGAMSVMASRGGGIDMKIRGLTDGVLSLRLELDQALKHAMRPEPPKKGPGHSGSA